MAALVNITWADVVARYPLVPSLNGATQAAILDEVAVIVANPAWGAKANPAAKALAAHFALMTTMMTAGGPMVSSTVGSTSVTFAVPPIFRNYEQTGPGRDFLAWRNSVADFTLMVV